MSFEDIHEVIELSIAPARTIYESELNTSVWHIKECYWIFKELMYEESDREAQIQSWQYVKAYVRILKDKGAWDYQHGAPYPDPAWLKLDPNTQAWMCHYMSHPEDQEAMHKYKRHWDKQKRMKICLGIT